MTCVKKPTWIKSTWPCSEKTLEIKKPLKQNKLKTVCEEAVCPNLGECFNLGTATFIIMGNICTRNCLFCNVKSLASPALIDPLEPKYLADAVKQMNLKYVVITSVTRDDLNDGGATHFTSCIKEIRKKIPQAKIEILTPDFRYYQNKSLKILGDSLSDVFNHNIETVPKLYSKIRPEADYQTSLDLLKKHKELYPNIPTKSGLMLGLGETKKEITETLHDLRKNNVDRLTLGQYLQPSKKHLDVTRFLTPKEFSDLAKLAYKIGFKHVISQPLARSSYYAGK